MWYVLHNEQHTFSVYVDKRMNTHSSTVDFANQRAVGDDSASFLIERLTRTDVHHVSRNSPAWRIRPAQIAGLFQRLGLYLSASIYFQWRKLQRFLLDHSKRSLEISSRILREKASGILLDVFTSEISSDIPSAIPLKINPPILQSIHPQISPAIFEMLLK